MNALDFLKNEWADFCTKGFFLILGLSNFRIYKALTIYFDDSFFPLNFKPNSAPYFPRFLGTRS